MARLTDAQLNRALAILPSQPTSAEEMAEFRSAKTEISVIDKLEAGHIVLMSGNDRYRDLLAAFDRRKSVSGSLSTDDVFATQIMVEWCKKQPGYDDVVALDFHVVMKKHKAAIARYRTLTRKWLAAEAKRLVLSMNGDTDGDGYTNGNGHDEDEDDRPEYENGV